ncbi:MAG: DUF4335 domain-containing protein [Waterburya sp.]
MSSKIHRFTPPTCTLEITEQKLPLSCRQPLDPAKQLQFELRFDDPRQTNVKQTTLKGNQQDLGELHRAISHYTQIQLQSSFQVNNLPPAPASITRDQEQPIPYLTPQGLTHHELFFGSLTHDSDRPSIRLGTVQLFDLVTALEAYQTKMLALSKIERLRPWQKIMPFWGGIASVGIIVAIAMVMIFKPQSKQNIASKALPSQTPNSIPELTEVTPPPLPNPDQQFVDSLKPRAAISSSERLPPPPAVETPKPKPDIPDPADYELSDVARQSGFDTTAKAKIATNQKTKSASSILAKIPIATTAPQTEITPRNQAQKQTDLEAVKSKDLEPKSAIGDNFLKKPVPRITTRQPSPIEEVAAYFEHKWEPPADLNQSLEYRLLLDKNGSIKRVVPLGKAAQLYLSQTNIPINGEPFISPLGKSQSSTIRLLLSPQGGVQVFAEGK